nr:unnamed protein product [Callosobruchus analis]
MQQRIDTLQESVNASKNPSDATSSSNRDQQTSISSEMVERFTIQYTIQYNILFSRKQYKIAYHKLIGPRPPKVSFLNPLAVKNILRRKGALHMHPNLRMFLITDDKTPQQMSELTS